MGKHGGNPISRNKRAASWAGALLLVALWGMLRLYVYRDFVFPLTFVLPLLICYWTRDRLMLWFMAACFTVMATIKMFWIMPDGALAPHERWATYLITLVNIGVGGVVVHLIINLRLRQEALVDNLRDANEQIMEQNEELQIQAEELNQQNEDLAQQAGELSQFNEELQSQAEEMEEQNEELQSQSEEIQELNVDLVRREKMLQGMLDSVRSLAGEQKIMDEICRAAREMMSGVADAVVVLERTGDTMLARAACYGPEGPPSLDPYPVANSFAGLVMNENRTASLDDTELRPDLRVLRLAQAPPFRAVLASPLRHNDKPVGVVGIYSHAARAWTFEQFRLVEWVAAHCSLILDTLRLQSGLRESEERFRAVYENAAIGIEQVARDGRLLAVNAELCRMLGFSADQLLARTYLDLTHPEDLPHELPLVERLWLGEIPSYRLEKRYLDRQGREVWVRVTSSLAQLPHPYRISVIEDITERKQAEERTLEQARALQEADRRKDEFLAMLAHELRNPLAPIRYAVQIMNAIGPREDALRRQQEIIERQVGHMARLLDDLLDVSRISRGKIKLHKEVLDLGAVVDQVIELIQPELNEHQLVLDYRRHDEPLMLSGDVTRLEQVLRNLMNNAIKYTDRGGRIEVVVDREKLNGTGPVAVVRVRDSGIGIAPEMLPHVFDMFTQADHSLDRAQGGLGIGLTMVKNLVEMHGGSVHAASDGPGHGSEFGIRLPLLSPAAAPGDTAAQGALFDGNGSREGGKIETLKVMVVEDNEDSAESLGELLQIWGHQVCVAHEGVGAIRKALDFQPDVVLLDIGLPEISGYEVARRMRAEAALDGVVLIALTGYGRDEDRRRAEDAGFNRHFTKPIDLSKLQTELKQLLGIRQ